MNLSHAVSVSNAILSLNLFFFMHSFACFTVSVQPNPERALREILYSYCSGLKCFYTGTGCPRRCGCPIPAGIQGQAGCGSGQPGLLVGDPAHSRGWELREHCGPFQPRPFCDSVMIFLLSTAAFSCISCNTFFPYPCCFYFLFFFLIPG